MGRGKFALETCNKLLTWQLSPYIVCLLRNLSLTASIHLNSIIVTEFDNVN